MEMAGIYARFPSLRTARAGRRVRQEMSHDAGISFNTKQKRVRTISSAARQYLIDKQVYQTSTIETGFRDWAGGRG